METYLARRRALQPLDRHGYGHVFQYNLVWKRRQRDAGVLRVQPCWKFNRNSTEIHWKFNDNQAIMHDFKTLPYRGCCQQYFTRS